MKFCVKCDNMYYITTTTDNTNKLYHFCKTCKYIDKDDVAQTSINILNTNLYKDQMHIDYFVNKYTKLDPTLPRIYNLPCPNNECVSNSTDNTKNAREVLYVRYNDTKMKYLYMCCKCDHIWFP
jgi:DNA-directed RNA polymerase subunit M/transcription elongation factor TFIIS